MRVVSSVLLALVLAGCASGVRARPRVGLGMASTAQGSFVGADLGEYGAVDTVVNVEVWRPVLIGAGILAATLVGVGLLIRRKA